LKAGSNVCDFSGRQHRASLVRCGSFHRTDVGVDPRSPANQPEHGSLQPAETEINSTRDIGWKDAIGRRSRRIAIGVCQPRGRKIVGAIVPRTGHAIDRRASGISEPKQLCDLVVRLACRIVSRSSNELVPSWLFDEIQARVTARNNEHRRRQWKLAVRKRERLDMPGEMMNGHNWKAARPCQCFRKCDTDEQRPDEAGTSSNRDCTDIVNADRCLLERRLVDSADIADVLSRRQLGDNSSPFAVDRDLGGDDVRANLPRNRDVSRLGNDRRRGLVAGCLNREQIHRALGDGRASRAFFNDSM